MSRDPRPAEQTGQPIRSTESADEPKLHAEAYFHCIIASYAKLVRNYALALSLVELGDDSVSIIA